MIDFSLALPGSPSHTCLASCVFVRIRASSVVTTNPPPNETCACAATNSSIVMAGPRPGLPLCALVSPRSSSVAGVARGAVLTSLCHSLSIGGGLTSSLRLVCSENRAIDFLGTEDSILGHVAALVCSVPSPMLASQCRGSTQRSPLGRSPSVFRGSDSDGRAGWFE